MRMFRKARKEDGRIDSAAENLAFGHATGIWR